MHSPYEEYDSFAFAMIFFILHSKTALSGFYAFTLLSPNPRFFKELHKLGFGFFWKN